VRTLLRVFFHFLYHQFAFAYDFVAASVSFGHWKNWILEVTPFIKGTRTLEIGHGPGHLQRFLLSRGLDSVAIDESSSMGRLAKRNVLKAMSLRAERHRTRRVSNLLADTEIASGFALAMTGNLTRGLAQHLPFADQSFDTVIATFPAEYITDPLTLREVQRCLSDGGRFVVLPVAMPKNRFLSWLFKVTSQAPSDAMKEVQGKLAEPFVKSGFNVETHVLDLKSGTLILIVASTLRAERNDER